MRFNQFAKILLLIFLVGGIVACVAVGELIEETQTVELGEAESVELDLDIGAGTLKVREEPESSWKATLSIILRDGNLKLGTLLPEIEGYSGLSRVNVLPWPSEKSVTNGI